MIHFPNCCQKIFPLTQQAGQFFYLYIFPNIFKQQILPLYLYIVLLLNWNYVSLRIHINVSGSTHTFSKSQLNTVDLCVKQVSWLIQLLLGGGIDKNKHKRATYKYKINSHAGVSK